MRLTITLIAMASLALFACTSDRVPTSAEQTQGPKPLFDHVVVVPTADVDVNNYALQLRPDHVFNGFYKMETQTLFAGELSYGNAPRLARCRRSPRAGGYGIGGGFSGLEKERRRPRAQGRAAAREA